MHYHMTDQATCLHTTDGRGLAVDFIGRVTGPTVLFAGWGVLHWPGCLCGPRRASDARAGARLTARARSRTPCCRRVESVDEDMQRVIAAINARLPPGVAPLRLPEEVAALNVGPKVRCCCSVCWPAAVLLLWSAGRRPLLPRRCRCVLLPSARLPSTTPPASHLPPPAHVPAERAHAAAQQQPLPAGLPGRRQRLVLPPAVALLREGGRGG